MNEANERERGRRPGAGIRALQTNTQRPSPTPIWPRISPPGEYQRRAEPDGQDEEAPGRSAGSRLEPAGDFVCPVQ